MADEYVAESKPSGGSGNLAVIIAGLAVIAIGGYAIYYYLTHPSVAPMKLTLTASPSSIVAGEGTMLTISGTGYTPNVTNGVSLAGTAGIATMHSTDSSGSFTTGPYNSNDTTTSAQTVTFNATDITTGQISPAVSVVFTPPTTTTNPVTPASPSDILFSVSPLSISYSGSNYTPTSLTVTGSGFTHMGAVQLYAQGSNGDEVIATYMAGIGGNLNESLPLSSYSPTAGPGYIYAYDAGSGNYTQKVVMTYTNTGTTTTTPTSPITTGGSIRISPTTVSSAFGNTLTIEGSGFNALSGITIYEQEYVNGSWSSASIVASNVSTGIDGNFGNITSYQVSLPAASGTTQFNIYAVDASGRMSNAVIIAVSSSTTTTPTTTPILGTISNPYLANSNGTLTWVAEGYYVVPTSALAGLASGTTFISSSTVIAEYNAAIAATTTTTSPTPTAWSSSSITIYSGSSSGEGSLSNPYYAYNGFTTAGYYFWPSYGDAETYCSSQSDFSSANTYIMSNYSDPAPVTTSPTTPSSPSTWSSSTITIYTGTLIGLYTTIAPEPAYMGYSQPGYYYWPSYGSQMTYCSSLSNFTAANAYITSTYTTSPSSPQNPSTSSGWSSTSVTTFTGSKPAVGMGTQSAPYYAYNGFTTAGYYFWPSYGSKETYCSSSAQFSDANTYITSTF